MSTTSLAKYFKNTPLITNVGEFSFIKQIGQGGNALVFSFKKNDETFAIKFIGHDDRGKLARFIDEYFCASQLNTHQNIARSYHFDSVDVDGVRYSLIVMRCYEASLKAINNIPSAPDEEKASKGWKLARALRNGLFFLHQNRVIHRDIKPENIFFDAVEDTFVIGDLGIAHFSDDFAREALTEVGDRLANYSFSPLDQIHPKGPPHPVWDIYAFGQVLSWYLFDTIVRGDGREIYSGDNINLAILDEIIHRCVKNDPLQRFQSIQEIDEFEKQRRTPPRDVFHRLYDLDEAFRCSIPKIDELYETVDQYEIIRFLTNFGKQCQLNEFWFIKSNGGDNTLGAFSKLNHGRWLLHNYYELKVEKLICFRHEGLYESLFILVTEADEPFALSDFDGIAIERGDISKWTSDVATLFDSKYMNPHEFKNGYYEHNGEVNPVDYSKTHERERILRPDAFMIVPDRTGPSRADRALNRDFLTMIADGRTITMASLKEYVHDANRRIDPEILCRL